MTIPIPTTGGPRWEPGQTAVLRYITTHDGQPGTTWPCRVICDRDDLVALFMPRGTTYKNWVPHWSSPDRHLGDARAPRDVLRLMFPGRWHSVWLFWSASDGTRRFQGYYVNFEEPFRRTAIGFDTNDHSLDIVVAPDLTWSWKDKEDFENRVWQGIYSEAFAEEVRAEAGRVIAAIEARVSPFADGWERWSPDPTWDGPVLPATWATEPVARWERWRWAYPSAQENAPPPRHHSPLEREGVTVAIRLVEAATHAQRLFRLFDENAQDATHSRAVVAEGAAQLWLAEVDDQLVGALLGRPMYSSDGEPRGGVDNLLVDARHRRRGIGRRLMEEAEAYYRTQDVSGMELSLNAENAVARSLYDAMGYQVVARYTRTRRDAAGEERTEPRLRMRKSFGTEMEGDDR